LSHLAHDSPQQFKQNLIFISIQFLKKTKDMKTAAIDPTKKKDAETKTFVICEALNVALTDLLSKPCRDTGVNPAEKSRFFDGEMNLNAKTRILEQHTDFTIQILVIPKPVPNLVPKSV
jgi:hypothetical protein